jgi:hypothetical protein
MEKGKSGVDGKNYWADFAQRKGAVQTPQEGAHHRGLAVLLAL